MEYRRLGKSGLKLSALSFGSWVTFKNQLDEKKATTLMSKAYESGVNFFDNAEAYAHGESEKIMGKIIKKLRWKRDTYCVSSKVFWGGDLPTQLGLSKKHVVEACHSALKRLQVEYLDLYFCHRPDPDTPIEETVITMHNLIQQGKILYWGTSEWSAKDIVYAYDFSRRYGLTSPTMEQPEYNLFWRHRVEIEYAELYSKIGLGTTIWSPLASGILTGKYSQGIPKGSRVTLKNFGWLKQKVESSEGKIKIEKTKRLEKIAKEINCSVTQLSIAWCLKNPHVSSVILGATSPSQLEENLMAMETVKNLTPDVLQKIENIVR